MASNLIDAFSPAYTYLAVTGRVLSFRRMRMNDWAEFIEQLRRERMDLENEKINAQVKSLDVEQRQRARMIAEQFIEERTGMRDIVRYCTEDVKGVARVLRWSALKMGVKPEEWDGTPAIYSEGGEEVTADKVKDVATAKLVREETIGYADLIPAPHQAQIATTIVHVPIVKGTNPSLPDGSKQEADTAGQNQTSSQTGKKSRGRSKTSSASTPAS